MQKTAIISLTTISIILLLLFLYSNKLKEAYNDGLEKGKLIEINKCQAIDITTNDINISHDKKVIKRKIINKRLATDHNVEWLFANRCPECKSSDSK